MNACMGGWGKVGENITSGCLDRGVDGWMDEWTQIGK